MGLKLRTRELPTVNFKRDLPKDLADGKKCFISISARAAGPLNTEYMAAMEAVGINAKVIDRKAGKIDDDEGNVRASHDGKKEIARQMFGAIYDSCVIEWSTSIIDADTDKPLVADRDVFLSLAELKGYPEIAKAIGDFQAECLAAGREMVESDEDTAKN